MKALVVGASGLVGGAILRHLGPAAVGTYRSRPMIGLIQLDAQDRGALASLLDRTRPGLVFFPAAEPNVDWCEEHPADAREANVVPALAALELSSALGARFVFFSSDYVFDGAAGPYREDAAPRPLQVYGRHKREVEEGVLAAGGTVIRTTHVFGFEPHPAKNFVLRLVDRLRAGERVRVPSDQVSTPTWSDDLASASAAVASDGGIWNVAGPDRMSRPELARAVARCFGLREDLVDAVPTSRLGQPAARPLEGGLVTDRLRARLGRSLSSVPAALDALRAQVPA